MMDEAPDVSTSVVFPPANFKIWPATRIGAIVIDVILLIVVLLLWFLSRRVYKLTTDEEETPSLLAYQRKLWGFWVVGVDKLRIYRGNLYISKKEAGSQCCSRSRGLEQLPKSLDSKDSRGKLINMRVIPVSRVAGVQLKKNRFFSLGLLWSFLLGCIFGIWLHFIPCIWWTCDWGHFDGQGVRGAIWFVTWGITCFVFSFLYRTVYLEIQVINPDKTDCPILIDMAVSEGSCRDLEDVLANYELQQVRKGVWPDT